jgi:hypothetical protein
MFSNAGLVRCSLENGAREPTDNEVPRYYRRGRRDVYMLYKMIVFAERRGGTEW